MNKYKLSEEVKKEYEPLILDFISKMECLTEDEIETMDNDEFQLELSDTKLNPYTLMTILKSFGYGNEEFNDNGWQLDYSIHLSKEGAFPSTCENLVIYGTGITFELVLSVAEFM